ncbi:MOSC domain-containing protein [Campylobacter sp. CCUG 57310]|uniref:MOSC domain-containing protein n=1 Tax=Campylobacter sp. CCUG 57310 TaxID=2517362 RepID=UPI0015677096|nr:MOSC domain-containing protein [Campylobacter sp. CCUG 57310]QKF92153.1 MOSC domain-containing protein [Campylobacter sp. CCUG 57310]
MAIVKALLIGEVKTYGDANSNDALNKIWQSAIFKTATEGEIYADKFGFHGDEVADKRHHGGVEKAIFANSYENYPVWSEFLGFANLPFGAMGENLTISGLHENDVFIGDVHKIGSLVLEVSQPRKPCFKLSKRWMNAGVAKEIFRSGLSGWYYRVLEAGSCKAGDSVDMVFRDSDSMSVADVNRVFYSPKENAHLIDKFMNLKALSAGWQDDMKRRIEGVYDTSYMDKI